MKNITIYIERDIIVGEGPRGNPDLTVFIAYAVLGS